MPEKTTVAFRVDPDVKTEWEEAAESHEYDSLSHLIRLAVQREITDVSPRQGTQESSVEEDSEVIQSLTRIERTVESLQDEVETVSREARASELYDLEQVLLEVLPTAPDGYNPAGPNDPSPEQVGQTPRTLAERLGADTSDVADAAGRLAENTAQVREAGGNFWRVE